MLTAIVVDDEELTSVHICRLLTKLNVEILGQYSNPLIVPEQVEALKPDVLFLDIEMPGMSGLELAERVYASGYSCEIVFITAYNQYAIEAFSVNALDYLLKPITPESIRRAVERVIKRTNTQGRAVKAETDKLEISMLGRFSVYVGSERKPVRWMTAKCAELFAYMLLNRTEGEVSKWKLMDAIWPEKNKEKADINLRSSISRLNKTLKENAIAMSVVSTGNGYRLVINQAEYCVDIFEYDKILQKSTEINSDNIGDYETIVYSYRGTLIEEIDGSWSEPHRTKYHNCFVTLAKKVIAYYLHSQAESSRVLRIVELLVQFEPYDEELRKVAVMQYFRLGGRQSAEKYYREYRDLFKGELGIELDGSFERYIGDYCNSHVKEEGV